MGQQNNEVDPESLRERRRGGCLDIFLVVSIVFLFLAVAAVAAGGVLSVMELRSKLQTSPQIPHFDMLRSTGVTPSPVYKMQNFVYLNPDDAILSNITVKWSSIPYGAGTSVGSNFIFDEEQHSLKPQKEGMYFIYTQLKFTCTHKCKAGLLSISVGGKLTCEVELPEGTAPVSKKCWTVTRLDGEKLFTYMTASNTLQDWKLEHDGSELGMFLVD